MKPFKSVLLPLSALLASFLIQAQEAPPWQIIDMHCHIVPNQMGGRGGGGSSSQSFPKAAAHAIELMNRYGVKTAVGMPPPFPPNLRMTFDIDSLSPAFKPYPGRLMAFGGGGSLNITLQQAAANPDAKAKAEFKKTALKILDKGASGFGEMCAEHLSMAPQHPYESVSPDHPLLLLLADLAAEKGVPIDIHMEALVKDTPLPEGLDSPPNPKVLKANIAAFERLLDHNPKATILWAHAGWDNTGDRTIELMERMFDKHPNLMMSVKISKRGGLAQGRPLDESKSLKPEWLAMLKKYSGRFVIGSDTFYPPPGGNSDAGSLATLEPIMRFISQLPPELRREICEENPSRILKLKGK